MSSMPLQRRVATLERTAAAAVPGLAEWIIEPDDLGAESKAAWLASVQAANPGTDKIIWTIVDSPRPAGGAA